MEILINNIKYNVIKNYRDALDENVLKEKMTDYFEVYDYVCGDWAYGKLRLKGFYNAQNSNAKKINSIENFEKYIKENCAYDCRYFLLEKKL